MSSIYNNRTKYTRTYSAPLGVDRDGDGSNISPRRLAYSENMYRDYKGEGGGVIESIPGFRKIAALGKKINGIFTQRAGGLEYLLIHSGTSLYRMTVEPMGEAVSIGTVSDTRTRGFCDGEDFYLLDGSAIYKINREGAFVKVERSCADVYVPTTYLNGKEYEQRNLLTNNFREEFFLADPWDVALGTSDILYTVTDPEAKYCAVSGVLQGFWGQLDIPRSVDIGGVRFAVKEILSEAFDGVTGLRTVRIGEGVEKIGNFAFRGCTSLLKVVMPDTVTEIGTGAFSHCDKLCEVYLGSGLKKLGTGVFELTYELNEYNYPLGPEKLVLVENYTELTVDKVNYRTRNRSMFIRLPLYTKGEEITRITVGGTEPYFDTVYDNYGAIAVDIELPSDYEAYGKTVVIEGIYLSGDVGFTGKGSSFLDTGAGKTIGGFDAVTKCTICERFDGRVFFSGNPDLPNTVFYTERDLSGENNALYIGAHNFFNDGNGYYPTVSMLAVRDALAVFKSGDDGEGSIFYHTPTDAEGNMQRIYPVAYVHSGVASVGGSKSFFDDPVFLTPLGLCGLTQLNISYERSVAVRSHNVNRDLLSEKLGDASLEVWCGYLALCVSGKIYLADSRATFTHESGNTEYEWFILNGIGTYRYDLAVWRYSSTAPPGYSVSETPDEIVEGTVFSEVSGGMKVNFAKENGKKCAVHETDERRFGIFYAAITYHAYGDRLFFGTDNGDVCVFNNDMRGKPPARIENAEGFKLSEYKSVYGNRIHPDFYSFINHAPRYAISTVLDNCGIPHLEKSTVKGSLSVKCRGERGAKIHLEVGTDRNGYSEHTSFSVGEFNFSDLDFSTITLDSVSYTTLPFKEKEKRWVEKQITLYSDSYACPIGIYSISYRYTVGGNIKKK